MNVHIYPRSTNYIFVGVVWCVTLFTPLLLLLLCSHPYIADPSTRHLNASVNEQKNAFHKHLLHVARFLSQPRFLVLFRHVCYLTGTAQSATRGPLEPGHGRVVVCDGVMVCLSVRHAYLSGRDHTRLSVGHSTVRGSHAVFRDRLLISKPTHRQSLSSLLGSGRDGVKVDVRMQEFVDWLDKCWEEGGGSYLRPFIAVYDVSEEQQITEEVTLGSHIRLDRSCLPFRKALGTFFVSCSR